MYSLSTTFAASLLRALGVRRAHYARRRAWGVRKACQPLTSAVRAFQTLRFPTIVNHQSRTTPEKRCFWLIFSFLWRSKACSSPKIKI